MDQQGGRWYQNFGAPKRQPLGQLLWKIYGPGVQLVCTLYMFVGVAAFRSSQVFSQLAFPRGFSINHRKHATFSPPQTTSILTAIFLGTLGCGLLGRPPPELHPDGTAARDVPASMKPAHDVPWVEPTAMGDGMLLVVPGGILPKRGGSILTPQGLEKMKRCK